MKNRRNRLLSNGLFYIIVFVILLAGINWAVGGSGSNGSTENIRYSQLVKDLKAGKVKSINVQPSNGVYIRLLDLIRKLKNQRIKIILDLDLFQVHKVVVK